jgi:hypothetical protein
VEKNLKVGIEMTDTYIESNVKRSKALILWSALYLGASWISTVASFMNSDSTEFKASDLLSLSLFPTTICALIYTFTWVRSLIVTARYIQPAGIGYRQGWAFWSWLTPFACFWIPRRLITRPFECFTWFTGRSNFLSTNIWWGNWIISLVISNLSLRAVFNAPELVPGLDLVSTIFLTIAFPQWKRIIESVTSAQSAAMEKLMNKHESNTSQDFHVFPECGTALLMDQERWEPKND